MSTYAFPDLTKPEAMMNAVPDMTGWTKGIATLPVSPLMLHPFAASAAMTALAVAVAGQVAGMMLGSVQGAMEASSRLGMMPAGVPMADSSFTAGQPASRAQTAPRRGAPVLRAVPKPEAAPSKSKAPVSTSGSRAAKTTGTLAHAKPDAGSAAKPALKAVDVARRSKAASAPTEFVRPAAAKKPDAPDDLKRISGIGPKLEEVLNGLGIWTFAQIGALKPAEIAWLDDYLQFSGRIERDTWLAQAAKLASATK